MSELVYPVVVDVPGRTSTTTLSELVEVYGFQHFSIPVHPDELTQLFSIVDTSNVIFDFSAIGEAVRSAETLTYESSTRILRKYLNAKFPWRIANFTAEWSYPPFEAEFTAFINSETTADCRTSILEQLDSNARYLVGPSQEYANFQSFTIVTDISLSTSLTLTLPEGINLSTFMLTPRPAIQNEFGTISGGRCIYTFAAGERIDTTIHVSDPLYFTVNESFSTRGNIVGQLRKVLTDGRPSIVLYDTTNSNRVEFPFETISGRQTVSEGTYQLSTVNTFTILDTSTSTVGTISNQEIINQADTLTKIQEALGQTYDFSSIAITVSETGLLYNGYFTASEYLLQYADLIQIYLDGNARTILSVGTFVQLIGGNDPNSYFIYNTGTFDIVDETTENPFSLLIADGSYATDTKARNINYTTILGQPLKGNIYYISPIDDQWNAGLGTAEAYNPSETSVQVSDLSKEYFYATRGSDIFTYPTNLFFATSENDQVMMNASYSIVVDATGYGAGIETVTISGTNNWLFGDVQNYRGSNVRAFAETFPFTIGGRIPLPNSTFTLPIVTNSFEFVVDSTPYTVLFDQETYTSVPYGFTDALYWNQAFWGKFIEFGHDANVWRFTRSDGTHLIYNLYTSGYDNAVEPGFLAAEHRTFTAEPIDHLYFILDYTTGTLSNHFYVGVNDATESLYTFLPSNLTLPESYELQNNNGEAVIYTANDAFNPPAGVYKLYPARTHFTYLYSGNTVFTGLIPGTSQDTFINTLMGFDTPAELSNVYRLTDTNTSEDVIDVVEGGTYILTTSYEVTVDGTGIGLTSETVPITVSGFMDSWNIALSLSNIFPGHIFGYPETLLYAGRTHLPIPNEMFTLADFRHYTINTNSVYVYTGAGQYTQYYWYYNLGLGLPYNGNYSRFVDTSTGIQYVYRPGQDTLDAVPPDDSTLLLETIVATYYITNGTETIYFGVAEGEDSNVILSNQITALGGTAIEEPYTIYPA